MVTKPWLSHNLLSKVDYRKWENDMAKRSRIFTAKRLFLGIAILLGATTIAAAAIPGPQRALCPTCFGMVEIDENIFIDRQEDARAIKALATLNESKKVISGFFGDWTTSPRILLCTKGNGPCTKMFGGLGPRGTAWGASLVRLNPLGMNETIMTHELFHAELASRMGQWGMWNNVIPKWFNEGLAVHLSGDLRFTYDYSGAEKRLAQSIVSYHDWKREVNAETWRTIYGASAQLVKDIEDKIGRDGLRELIRRVTQDGADFEVVAAKLMAG